VLNAEISWRVVSSKSIVSTGAALYGPFEIGPLSLSVDILEIVLEL
jgi:hypothetical protein